MPVSYAETLALLTKAWQGTAEILRRSSREVSHTALCNRLAWLCRKGFARRSGTGGRLGYEWRRA